MSWLGLKLSPDQPLPDWLLPLLLPPLLGQLLPPLLWLPPLFQLFWPPLFWL
jgi:hypothetical protein